MFFPITMNWAAAQIPRARLSLLVNPSLRVIYDSRRCAGKQSIRMSPDMPQISQPFVHQSYLSAIFESFYIAFSFATIRAESDRLESKADQPRFSKRYGRRDLQGRPI